MLTLVNKKFWISSEIYPYEIINYNKNLDFYELEMFGGIRKFKIYIKRGDFWDYLKTGEVRIFGKKYIWSD